MRFEFKSCRISIPHNL